MTTRTWRALSAVILSGVLACSGGGDDGGGGPVPYATLTPATLAFGSVAVGASATLTAQVGNTSAGALSVTGVTACAGSSAAYAVSPTGAFTVAAGASQTLTVTFAPAALGAASGCWNVATGDPAAPTLQLTATGTGISECDLAANVARRAELEAAQPVLAVRTKTVITPAVTFSSVAGHPTIQCPVTLSFKDLNGNGTLEGYEDWRLGAAERAADLLGRMGAAEKLGLLAHATPADNPTPTNAAVSAELQASIAAGIRFGRTAASNAQLNPRATWANNVQALCEASGLGVPFVLSMEPAHGSGNGRVKARGFSQWPNELGLAASADLAVIEGFGQVVSQEYRAIGVRMALSASANLATEPRWFDGQFTFGEDGAQVAARVGALVKGLQGTAIGPASVAAVVAGFPGAGAAKGGWDARLAKGKLLTYAGGHLDMHAGAFQTAFDNGVAGVMPSYGVPETGTWTGLGGVVDGATIEQVGASFNADLLTDVLRGHYAFGGLVVAPLGVLEDAGVSPLGAPWGMESATKAQRIAKAVGAGVDQLVGLNDTVALAAAGLTGAQVDAAAGRALALALRLGLFENPYVDPAQAPALCNTDTAYRAGLDAMNRGMVLLVNARKPFPAWLSGSGDGSQTGDPGNAGNGTGLVLPAPPGQPYIAAGCDYFIAGDFDLDYVRSVSTGYGTLTNDASNVKGVEIPIGTPPAEAAAMRMALSDYVFIRIAAPYTADPDSGALGLPLQSLEYAGNDPSVLAPVLAARQAIAAWNDAGKTPASYAQIVVGVDSGRPSVVSELLSDTYDISGLYLEWMGTMPANVYADKVFLDVAFGIVDGTGTLPVGLPASDTAAAAQLPDAAGDGQDATFVRGFGLSTNQF